MRQGRTLPLILPFRERGQLALSALLECARRQLWVVRAEDTAFNPATGNSIIVLTTGSATLAREIGGEWTFWQTGKVGLDTLMLFDAPNILFVWLAGVIVIVGLVSLVVFVRRRRAQEA